MKYVVLYSGGPDSLISYRWAQAQADCDSIQPVCFDLGHRYRGMEAEATRRTLPETVTDTTLRGMGDIEENDAHIFARNLHLLTAAARYLPIEGGALVLTVQKDELSIPDRSPTFLLRMEGLLSDFREKVVIPTPWMTMDKTDMVGWYVDSSAGAVSTLLKTRSCYRPGQDRWSGEWLQCGQCAACIRRFVAFSLNGLEESYVQDPRASKLGKEYVDRAARGAYSPDRCARIQSALGE